MISKQQIEDVKNRVCIVDFISQYVTLNTKGNSLCPFLDHNDSNASFSVSQEKQIFKCFGSCGRSGNVYTFLMNYKNINFVEAVKEVAKYVGIKIEEEKKDNLSTSIYDLYESMTKRFIGQLNNYDNYFMDVRKLSQRLLDKFKLGYCDNSYNCSYTGMKELYEDIVINESKLFYEDGRCAFHDRYIFPLIDISGSIIGFGGKSLNKEQAPYKNSADSNIYDKSKFLYGLWQAQNSIKKKKFVIVTEGYFDCLSMHEKGLDNTVAICGTALTYAHAKLLKRYTDNVILFLDGDKAGYGAVFSCYASLLSSGLKVCIILTPEDEDPDSISKDMVVLKHLIKNPFTFYKYLNSFGLDTSGKIERCRRVAEKINDKVHRELFIKEMSEKLGVSQSVIYNDSVLRKKKKDIGEVNKEMLLLAGILNDKSILGDAFIKKYKFKGKFSKQLLLNICTVNDESNLYNGLEKDDAELLSKIILLSKSGLTPQYVISSLQYDEFDDKIKRLVKQIKNEEQDGGDTLILRKEFAELLNKSGIKMDDFHLSFSKGCFCGMIAAIIIILIVILLGDSC